MIGINNVNGTLIISISGSSVIRGIKMFLYLKQNKILTFRAIIGKSVKPDK